MAVDILDRWVFGSVTINIRIPFDLAADVWQWIHGLELQRLYKDGL